MRLCAYAPGRAPHWAQISVWELSGASSCLELTGLSGSCLGTVWELSGSCLGAVWELSGSCLFGDGVGIHAEDLRALSISRRFPAGYTFTGTIHGQDMVPERQRRNLLSDEEKNADSPHPGHNGFVEASMERE